MPTGYIFKVFTQREQKAGRVSAYLCMTKLESSEARQQSQMYIRFLKSSGVKQLMLWPKMFPVGPMADDALSNRVTT